MEIKYLQTFLTIIEEGSFSKAAQKLNYTQSTITFQVNQLEQEFSITLFEKIGRNMLLTKAGKEFVPYVKNALNEMDKLYYFEKDLAEYQGDLHIGVGETLLCYKLPNIIKKFHNIAPKTKLFIRSMNCYDIRNSILNGTLDIGVLYEDIGGLNSNIISHNIGIYDVILVASPDIKEKYSDFITPNQNIPVAFIINETNCIFRQIFERYLQQKSIMLSHTIELWSIPTIKNLVKNNIGLSYLPKFTVESELKNGELVEIPTEITHSNITAVCAYHKNKWVSPTMQLFIDIIKNIKGAV